MTSEHVIGRLLMMTGYESATRFPDKLTAFYHLARNEVLEEAAVACEELEALPALDGEEVGNAAMVRVADRQAALCAEKLRGMKK